MGRRALWASELVPDVPRDLPMGARDPLAGLQLGSTNPRHEHPGQAGAAAESPVRLFLRVAVGFRAGRDRAPPGRAIAKRLKARRSLRTSTFAWKEKSRTRNRS